MIFLVIAMVLTCFMQFKHKLYKILISTKENISTFVLTRYISYHAKVLKTKRPFLAFSMINCLYLISSDKINN